MIKFTLTMWVCSFLQGQTCLPPIHFPVMYDSWYECSRAAHQESVKIMSDLGYKVVNRDRIAMKYRCKEVGTI